MIMHDICFGEDSYGGWYCCRSYSHESLVAGRYLLMGCPTLLKVQSFGPARSDANSACSKLAHCSRDTAWVHVCQMLKLSGTARAFPEAVLESSNRKY